MWDCRLSSEDFFFITLFFLFNPFTAKFSRKQISTKFPNFILWNFEKQIAPCVSTGRELSFEWSHHRILSAESKVRVTLQNSIKHSGSERVKEKKIKKCTAIINWLMLKAKISLSMAFAFRTLFKTFFRGLTDHRINKPQNREFKVPHRWQQQKRFLKSRVSSPYFNLHRDYFSLLPTSVVKRRRIVLEMNSWESHPSSEKERKFRRSLFTSQYQKKCRTDMQSCCFASLWLLLFWRVLLAVTVPAS